MNTFKRWLICLGLMFFTAGHCPAEQWLVDCDIALHKARAENKAVLLDFTGSDWCGWCMKFKSEVLDQPEFTAYADANLVLVEVDFPHRWVLSSAQQEANKALAQKYGVNGFPTFILLNPSGEKIGSQTGYSPGGPKAFIGKLEKMRGTKHSNIAASAPNPPPAVHAPDFVPVPPTTAMHYGELALKGISGSASRRMALINNETFLVGETAKVKVKDTKVEVTCKEIRPDSVLLTVDGKTVELKLPHQ